MKFNRALLIVISGILVLSLAFPGGVFAAGSNAAPSTVKLTINNKVGQAITLKLTGPTNYSFNVPTGKSEYQVQPGKYRYEYQACNGTKKGTVVIQNKDHKLTLAACKAKGASGGAPGKVTIDNDTGGYITLQLVGPQTYNFTLPPGKSPIQVIKGKYTYTVWDCGGAQISGSKNLRPGLVWRFWCS